MKKFWNFRNAEDGTGELTLYGDISSQSWWGDEITPKQFKEDLDALGDVRELRIFINSGGGDVFAGQAIHSMLSRHKAHKTVYVDGLAASIASLIAMAGDTVIMPKNAMMMIHNAWTFAIGNKEELRKQADDMEKIDDSIVAAYEAKTGKDADEIRELMKAETWFTAEEAVSEGFADEIEETKQVAAAMRNGFLEVGSQRFDVSRYNNMPQVAEEEVPPPQEEEPDNGAETDPQPAADKEVIAEQKEAFQRIRKKILEV